MHNINDLNVELVTLTPEMAQHYRETMKYERQRKLSEPHRDRLAREMVKDHFIAGTLIHICKVGDSAYIVNGQHTIDAVSESGVALPLTFLTTNCRSMKEVGEIYARHDQGRVRDWASALRATGTYESLGLGEAMTNALAAAMKTVMLGFKAHGGIHNPIEVTEINYSRDLRIDKMHEYKRAAVQYAKCVAQAERKHQARLRRAAVMAVALETFRYQPKKAHEFWEGVAKDDGLKRNDPRKTYISYLLDHVDQRNKERYKGPRAAAVAWNAFFDGQKLDKIAVPQVFVLHGTPWGQVEKKGAKKGMIKTGIKVDPVSGRTERAISVNG